MARGLKCLNASTKNKTIAMLQLTKGNVSIGKHSADDVEDTHHFFRVVIQCSSELIFQLNHR